MHSAPDASLFLLYSPVALCLHIFQAVRAVSKYIKYESQKFMSLTSECIEYEERIEISLARLDMAK